MQPGAAALFSAIFLSDSKIFAKFVAESASRGAVESQRSNHLTHIFNLCFCSFHFLIHSMTYIREGLSDRLTKKPT